MHSTIQSSTMIIHHYSLSRQLALCTTMITITITTTAATGSNGDSHGDDGIHMDSE